LTHVRQVQQIRDEFVNREKRILHRQTEELQYRAAQVSQQKGVQSGVDV
jgi:hypothetical protein